MSLNFAPVCFLEKLNMSESTGNTPYQSFREDGSNTQHSLADAEGNGAFQYPTSKPRAASNSPNLNAGAIDLERNPLSKVQFIL